MRGVFYLIVSAAYKTSVLLLEYSSVVNLIIAAPPMNVLTLIISVSFIYSTWELPLHRYAGLIMEFPKFVTEC